MPMSPPRRRGFTLIELSIVLVILGLLVGGVLAGRALIQAAQLQKTAGQRAQFDAAEAAFELKYDVLPGDLPNAEGRGLVPASADPVKGGDGDGQVGGVDSTLLLVYEPVFFWQELYAAGLLAGDPGCNSGGLNWGTPKYPPCVPLAPLPYAVVNRSPGDSHEAAVYWVRKYPGGHYYQLLSTTGDDAGFQAACGYTGGGGWCNALTAADAQAIDQKLDDGLPMSGGVLAAGGSPNMLIYGGAVYNAASLNNPTAGPAGGGTCVTTDATPVYNLTSTTPYRCSLNLRTGF